MAYSLGLDLAAHRAPIGGEGYDWQEVGIERNPREGHSVARVGWLRAAVLVPEAQITLWVTLLSLVFLALLGAVGAKAGGAPMGRAVLRVAFWGAVAMAVTAGVGKLFGAVV